MRKSQKLKNKKIDIRLEAVYFSFIASAVHVLQTLSRTDSKKENVA
jgi:hypothetical protein